MKFKAVLLSILLALVACQDSSPTLLGVQLRLVSFGGIRPVEVVFVNIADSGAAGTHPIAQATLKYQLSPEDQMEIGIQEFKDPVQAYGYWCGSGMGPSRIPVLKAGIVEQSVWSGRWIFLFRYPPHRQPSSNQMDSLVRAFPESGGDLPSIFLTMPLHHRVAQGTTIQNNSFQGIHIPFQMLEQRYRDEVGTWSMGRSLDAINEAQMDGVLKAFSEGHFKIIRRTDEFSSMSNGTTQLILGRVSGVFFACWGRMDLESLALRWHQGSISL